VPTSADRVVYLDSSALVKLAVVEPETAALRRYLRSRGRRASSAIARVEVVRAARSHGPRAAATARQLLVRVDLVRLEDPLLDSAATLGPPLLRSLDAVHLATALSLGSLVEAFVTYDDRLASAARELGFSVRRPG
jgi:hypothetical protein